MENKYEVKYKISEELWKEIEPLIPGTKGKWGGVANDNKDFIESVLCLIFNKSPFSSRLFWNDLGSKKRANYNRRFTNWRNKGIWEFLLPVLVKYEECNWLAEPYKYEVLLSNYSLVSMLNQTYICTCETSEYYDDCTVERLTKEYPHFMKNLKRRRKAALKRNSEQASRGAYMKKYTPEEQEYFKYFEL